MFIHIDNVPVVRPNSKSEKDETEQTRKSSTEDHHPVPHLTTAELSLPCRVLLIFFLRGLVGNIFLHSH